MNRRDPLFLFLLLAAACGGDAGGGGGFDPQAALLDPSLCTLTAPETFQVRFETTRGEFVVEAHRDWAPLGVDRFYNLVRAGFFDDVAFFRVIKGFIAQFGLHGDTKVIDAWAGSLIVDDPRKQSNQRGFVTFATRGNHTRTTQLFINYKDNSRSLDGRGFTPFARVVKGMEVVDRLYGGYGDGPPRGPGPNQMRIKREGNKYLAKEFPKLDYIRRATVVD